MTEGPLETDALVHVRGQAAALKCGLWYWSLRRLRQRHYQEEAAEVCERMAAGYGSAQEVHKGASAAFVLEDTTRSAPWEDWILSDLPSGEVHMISGREGLLHAYVVLALLKTNPDVQTAIKPADWLARSLEELENLTESVAAEDELWSALGFSPDAPARDAWLRDIRAAAAAQREVESQELAAAPLDSERVERLPERDPAGLVGVGTG